MIAPRPDVLLTLGWREMRNDAWAVPMARLHGGDRERIQTKELYSVWWAATAPRPAIPGLTQGATLGLGLSLQDSQGCLGWVLRTQLSLSALQYRLKDPLLSLFTLAFLGPSSLWKIQLSSHLQKKQGEGLFWVS